MNPKLNDLQPYPFQKLRQLLEGVKGNNTLKAINLHIGEPKHETPDFIRQAITKNLDGLSAYPMTLGSISLREALANWIQQRFNITKIDSDTEVIPVIGSREALFSFAQAVVDTTRSNATVMCPNPFYQIYEGAVLLAGAKPFFLIPLRKITLNLIFHKSAKKFGLIRS